MTLIDYTEPAAYARMDELLLDLVQGASGAHEAWLSEAQDLLQAAPKYDVGDAITAAIEAVQEWEAVAGPMGVHVDEAALARVLDESLPA